MASHYNKDLDNRLAAAQGHIAAIRRMLEESRSCEDILMQLAATESSINKVSKIILRDHLTHCVRDSIECGDRDALDSFSAILEKYIK